MDGRVDEGLHHEEHVRRAGAGHGRGHGHELLVVDLDLGPEAAQQRRCLHPLVLGCLRGRIPDRHPLAEPGRRVRHRAHHLVVAKDADEGRGGRSGQHRQDELPALQVRPDLAADAVEHLGLDAQQDHVRAFDCLDVRLDRPDAVLPGKLLPTLRSRMAGDHLARFDELAAQDPGDHGLRHDARTDGRDRALLQGGHRAEYRPRHSFHGPPLLRPWPVRGGRIGRSWRPPQRRNRPRAARTRAPRASSRP